MDSRYINKIPDNHLKRMKPCWKCGRLPVIYSYTGYWNQISYICCPNDDCDNKVLFNKRMNEGPIESWNKQNVEKFIPKSNIQSIIKCCFNCKHCNSCAVVRDEYIKVINNESTNEFLLNHICEDFEECIKK